MTIPESDTIYHCLYERASIHIDSPTPPSRKSESSKDREFFKTTDIDSIKDLLQTQDSIVFDYS